MTNETLEIVFTNPHKIGHVVLDGPTRIVESSHRGMPADGFCQMASNLYVGSGWFKYFKAMVAQ